MSTEPRCVSAPESRSTTARARPVPGRSCAVRFHYKRPSTKAWPAAVTGRHALVAGTHGSHDAFRTRARKAYEPSWRLPSVCHIEASSSVMPAQCGARKDTMPVAKSYIAPATAMRPVDSRSFSTGLSCRIVAVARSTFVRATASTNAMLVPVRAPL